MEVISSCYIKSRRINQFTCYVNNNLCMKLLDMKQVGYEIVEL